jgi:response regulator RpfG family c-di-GMP phosphodiesterase
VTNSLRLRDLEQRRRRSNVALESIAITRPTSLATVLSDLADPTARHEAADADLAQRLASTLALRDDELGSHIERTSAYVLVLGGALLDDGAARDLSLAMMLHDIGKIGVPDEILLKARPLDAAEMDVMRRHAELGHRLLAASSSPLLRLAASVALTHHERCDGGGYPRGLAGDAIPIEGRIAAVADVFDALTTDRADRPAHSIDAAVDLILTGAGSQFDPAVVDAFQRCLPEIRELCPSPTQAASRSTSVLIVDDQTMFAESVARLIDRERDLHVVGVATTVAAAIELALETKPAVVLMDWELPDGDGIAAARSILDELPATKVVLLTGRSDDNLLVAAMRAGCAGFVSKADALSALVTAVRTVAAGDPAVPTGKLVTLLSRLEQNEPIRGSRTRLSARELEVLSLLARGLDADAIAARLVLSGHTVRNHLRNAMAKLDAHTRLEAVTTAARLGIIDLG